MDETSDREAVARIVDPDAARWAARMARDDRGDLTPTEVSMWQHRWRQALRKADGILALLEARRGGGGG